MTSLAIPSVPPPAVGNIDAGTPAADSDSRFEDALRESQAQPKAPHDGLSSDPDTGTSPRNGADADTTKQDDKATAKDPTVLPGMIPAVPVATAPVRQDAAAAGKAVPAAASPAGAQPADPRSKPLSPALVAAQSPVAIPPNGSAPMVDAPIAQAPGARSSGIGVPIAKAPMANAADKKAPIADGSGANVPVAQADGTEPAGPSAPETDAATVLGMSDPDAIPPAADSRSDTKTLPDSGPNAFTTQLVQFAGIHAGTAPAQPPSAPAQLAMQSAPGQPQFAQEVGQHVSWLAGQNIQQAEIQLNPKKLGPIQVEITTHHDRVDVTFAVQHPQTVHALQQTLPQLHDMLAQQGLNLGHASVGQQAPGRQHPAFAQHAGGGRAGRDSGSGHANPPTWRSARVAVPGRVDDFA